jgi:ATP-dependent Clp protease ATP-binding subunit ClpA
MAFANAADARPQLSFPGFRRSELCRPSLRQSIWRFTRPYRGLEAMTEANSDYFFGRDRKTVEIIHALASAPGKLPILLGNSGVGKSSLARRGAPRNVSRELSRRCERPTCERRGAERSQPDRT